MKEYLKIKYLIPAFTILFLIVYSVWVSIAFYSFKKEIKGWQEKATAQVNQNTTYIGQIIKFLEENIKQWPKKQMEKTE